MTAPDPDFDAAREALTITENKLHALDPDEKAGMLFFLVGFLQGSEEFQDALTRAYNAQMRSRERRARPAL